MHITAADAAGGHADEDFIVIHRRRGGIAIGEFAFSDKLNSELLWQDFFQPKAL